MVKPFDPDAFIRRVGERLVREFTDAKAATTPSTISTAAEQPVRNQPAQLLPRSITVGEGFVIDSYGETSRQQDVVLYERDICPTPRRPPTIPAKASSPSAKSRVRWTVPRLRMRSSEGRQAPLTCRSITRQDLGFEERIRGSHHLYRKQGVVEKINLQRDDGHAKPYQVRQVRRVILKYKLDEDD